MRGMERVWSDIRWMRGEVEMLVRGGRLERRWVK